MVLTWPNSLKTVAFFRVVAVAPVFRWYHRRSVCQYFEVVLSFQSMRCRSSFFRLRTCSTSFSTHISALHHRLHNSMSDSSFSCLFWYCCWPSKKKKKKKKKRKFCLMGLLLFSLTTAVVGFVSVSCFWAFLQSMSWVAVSAAAYAHWLGELLVFHSGNMFVLTQISVLPRRLGNSRLLTTWLWSKSLVSQRWLAVHSLLLVIAFPDVIRWKWPYTLQLCVHNIAQGRQTTPESFQFLLQCLHSHQLAMIPTKAIQMDETHPVAPSVTRWCIPRCIRPPLLQT